MYPEKSPSARGDVFTQGRDYFAGWPKGAVD